MTWEDWMADARCRDRSIVGLSDLTSPDKFYPDLGSSKADPHKENESAAPAKRVCAMCPVRTECMKYALEMEEGKYVRENGKERWRHALPWGIWGGHTQTERHRVDIEHMPDCRKKYPDEEQNRAACKPPCRDIDDRVVILEDLFQFKITTLVTKREREELAS